MNRVHPPSRAARRLVVVLAAGLVVAGCSGEPAATASTTTRAVDDTSTTTTAGSGEPEEQAVLQAYTESWAVFELFVNGDPPGEPADYYEGDQLANVLARVTQYATDGLELRGQADLLPHDVRIVGRAASLIDCQVDGTYAVERSTGDVVIPAGERPQRVVVELVHAGGRWKVSSVDYGDEGSCER